jgi:hypothetical protein
VIEERFEKELETARKQLDITSTTVTKDIQGIKISAIQDYKFS